MMPTFVRNKVVDLVKDEPSYKYASLMGFLDGKAAEERFAPAASLIEKVALDPSQDDATKRVVLSFIANACGKRSYMKGLLSRLKANGLDQEYERKLGTAATVLRARALGRKLAAANDEFEQRTGAICRQADKDVAALERLEGEMRKVEKDAQKRLREVDNEEGRVMRSLRPETEGVSGWVRRVFGRLVQ